jgi:predicted transglutaminase-like cysteine proteinase
LLRRLRGLPRAEQIEQVDPHFNQFPYVADYQGNVVRDIWLSPLSFIQTSGDCADYAIAKYFVLRLLGIPDEDLRILIVRDTLRQQGHAVLLVKTAESVAVLDNQSQGHTLASLPHYLPLLAFNARRSWRLDAKPIPTTSAGQ